MSEKIILTKVTAVCQKLEIFVITHVTVDNVRDLKISNNKSRNLSFSLETIKKGSIFEQKKLPIQ